MEQPQVRTIDQLTQLTNGVYDPRRQANQAMIDSANSRLTDQTSALDAAKNKGFQDITQNAVRRGALFSGFTPNAQATYLSEKYLPALADLRAANESTIQGINKDTLSLNAQQIQQAIDTQQQDQNKLYDWQKTQQQHQWETEAAQKAYDQEIQKLRLQASLSASANAASSAASKPSTQQFLVQAFAGYKPAYEGGQAYYTERQVIPALMANYGLSQKDAANLAYAYRKQAYGEGYGSL